MRSHCSPSRGFAAVLLCATTVAQIANPDRGYTVAPRATNAAIPAFAMDTYHASNGDTIVYTCDFRNRNSVYELRRGQAPKLVVSGFGSGNASIGDLTVDPLTGKVYVHDGTHGAIYEIDPGAATNRVRVIATSAAWITAFGNGGIDFNPADNRLYLLTPGTSVGGIYRIDTRDRSYPVTTIRNDLKPAFAAMGLDVRPDVIRFDCGGNLWGSARDLDDLSNRPSIIYRIEPPLRGKIEIVLQDRNIGTVADLEFDTATDDLFIACTSANMIVRFSVDRYLATRTRPQPDRVYRRVADNFPDLVQGIAFGNAWSARSGRSLMVATNKSSHLLQRVENSSVYEVGPFAISSGNETRRCQRGTVLTARGVEAGMRAFSMVARKELRADTAFALGKSRDLTESPPRPGVWRLHKNSRTGKTYDNSWQPHQFLDVTVADYPSRPQASGISGRGDLIETNWLHVDGNRPTDHGTRRMYVHDEQLGYVYVVDPAAINPNAALQPLRPRPDRPAAPGNTGFRLRGQGAIAIGPDFGLWVVVRNPQNNRIEVRRAIRQIFRKAYPTRPNSPVQTDVHLEWDAMGTFNGLAAAEVIDDIEVDYNGTIFAAVWNPTTRRSRVLALDPITETVAVVYAGFAPNERLNTMAMIDPKAKTAYNWGGVGNARWPYAGWHSVPDEFFFGTAREHGSPNATGAIYRWTPKQRPPRGAGGPLRRIIHGFRFPVTTIAFPDFAWLGPQYPLLVMSGVDQPKLADFWEFGPFAHPTGDSSSSSRAPNPGLSTVAVAKPSKSSTPRTHSPVSFWPQGTHTTCLEPCDSGSLGRNVCRKIYPFVRVHGNIAPNASVKFLTKWGHPNSFGLPFGSLMFVIAGDFRYPGAVRLPGLYPPVMNTAMVAFGRNLNSAFSNRCGAGSVTIDAFTPAALPDFGYQAFIFENPWNRPNPPLHRAELVATHSIRIRL